MNVFILRLELNWSQRTGVPQEQENKSRHPALLLLLKQDQITRREILEDDDISKRTPVV